jgi:hypothetical protein
MKRSSFSGDAFINELAEKADCSFSRGGGPIKRIDRRLF